MTLVFQFGDDSEVVEGTYSYLTPEGEEVEVAYTANENGYFPSVRFINQNHACKLPTRTGTSQQ